jgi:Flp pilus assembly protein TadG
MEGRRSRSLRRRLHELGRCDLGAISVELAVLSPVFVLLVLGTIDFGRAFNEQLRLANAARAGAQFAIENLGTSESLTGITEAVLRDAQLPADQLTIAASKSCTCPSGAAAACSSICADGLPPRMHVEVTVQRDFKLLFDYPVLPSTLALSETATMRTR